ncbi:hypothetical protein [Spirosoma sp. 209]|uniref:hypothetical protein n=1 Tax=Spirosoma sp. 209 TaxID=1955701 RepID=UPI00098D1F00|nr:hypothetical protein [Spirosoma sp. 209]
MIVEDKGALGSSWYDQIQDKYFLPFVTGLMHFPATTGRVGANVSDQVIEPAQLLDWIVTPV